MAGTQIVLHSKDEEDNNKRDETRNLGLQSIVYHENNQVGQLISDASKQANMAADINNNIVKLTGIMNNLQWAANAIYKVVNAAYMSDIDKTQKFIDIQKGALDDIRTK